MATPILVTKLYIPPPRVRRVLRFRLLERLNEGLNRKLTLVSAPAGFGKTTLVSEWVAGCEKPVAWLSLDEGDGDPTRFLVYLVAALQGVAPNLGAGALRALESPQPPSTEAVLTALLNEITAVPASFVLVLDDYHTIDARAVDQALAFLLEHLPPQMHLVITTREDPKLPLARLRARGQLSELRAADLRFTISEAAEFLEGVMGLNLSAEDVALLDTHTEGWIAGLQLVALSVQGRCDATRFIKSFTGSHRFVLDYLLEEVLQRQPESVQAFLLQTAILDRLSGPLCDAVTEREGGGGMLEALEQGNLFVVPLDEERRWYRYHHLFAEVLRQRLHQFTASPTNSFAAGALGGATELHLRASVWYEDNDLELEAFRHAAAANDVERSERLIQGKGMPLYLRGGAARVLDWLGSLPKAVLDARPSLWVMYATALSITGQMTRVEQKLQAAERAMQGVQDTVPDDKARDLIGRIADLRALVALMAADPRPLETIIAQSRRALAYLHPENLPGRAGTTWKLGLAYQFRGDRAAARQAHTEAVAISEASGNVHVNILATTCLGYLQELDNQLSLATQTYRRVLHLVGDPPGPVACEAHVGLARIYYQWNDLKAAEAHGQMSAQLSRQLEIDSFVTSELFLARLKLAQGDVSGATSVLDKAEAFARRYNFMFRLPDIAAAQVLTLLRRGNLTAAAQLAQTFELPISRARVQLAQGDASIALAVLGPLRQQAEAKAWVDQRLEVMVLQAVAHHTHGETDKAMHLLGDVLALAEPGGFIRLFVDEGSRVAHLLSEAAARGVMPNYAAKLLAAFDAEMGKREQLPLHPAESLLEPLSTRELEVLRLVAKGLSNREISKRLFRALSTVKGHNRIIFDKLQVQSRTEAVARARELNLL